MLGRRHTPKPEALALTSTLTLTEVPQRPPLTNQELETLRNAFFCLIGTFSTGLYVAMPTNPKEKKAENETDAPPNYSELLHKRVTSKMVNNGITTLNKHLMDLFKTQLDATGNMPVISSPGLLKNDSVDLKMLNYIINKYYTEREHATVKIFRSVQEDIEQIKQEWALQFKEFKSKTIDEADLYNAFRSVPVRAKKSNV